MVIFLTLCSFFSVFLSLLTLFLFAHYINTHFYKVYKPDRPQTTNANEKEKQLKIAPHATSTKNGSPSATCATTFCAACEASGEMTVAAMRAVVAMAVCFIYFVVNVIVWEREEYFGELWVHSRSLSGPSTPPLDKISSRQRKKRKLSASLSNRNTIRSSRCEGRIECTSSALTRRRSCGYEFGVVEFAVKTMRRVLLRARARARDDCKKKIISL